MHVLLFLGRLDSGGAERQFVQLADGLVEKGHEVTLVTIFPGGKHWNENKGKKIDLVSLHHHRDGRVWRRFAQHIGSFYRFQDLVKHRNPDVVYSALDIANLISGFSSYFFKDKKLVWGVRNSSYSTSSRVGKYVYKISNFVGHKVDLVISNSVKGREFYEDVLTRCKKWEVIPNGIDTDRFYIDEESGARIREEWRVSESTKIVGFVGRLVPIKGLEVLVEALRMCKKDSEDFLLVIVGKGNPSYIQKIREQVSRNDLKERVIWAGHRNDMMAIYNAFDVLVLPSLSEGFSNVIGEALACGCPCVTTDVGDSARLVECERLVVQKGEPGEIHRAIAEVFQSSPSPEPLRQHIMHKYDVNALVEKTENALSSVE
jgi:glycosyltransferase involved in cell wall biosynthesis